MPCSRVLPVARNKRTTCTGFPDVATACRICAIRISRWMIRLENPRTRQRNPYRDCKERDSPERSDKRRVWVPTQPDRRKPHERARYCPVCHLRIASQEPQVSKQGHTFHEGCALKYDQLQQSPRLPTNAPAAESGSREAALNSSSADDLAVERATSHSGSVKRPASTRSATKMISTKKKAQTRKAVSRKHVGKTLVRTRLKDRGG